MNEKEYLKELSRKYLEIANSPIMKQRENLWYSHNDGDKNATPIIMELDTFLYELLPPLLCEDPLYRDIEILLQRDLVRFSMVCDDKVVSSKLCLPALINVKLFDVEFKKKYAGNIGYHTELIINDLEKDLSWLNNSKIYYNDTLNSERLEKASEIIETELENTYMYWPIMHSKYAVDLMGMENLFVAIMDTPELVNQLFDIIAKDCENILKDFEKYGALTSNTGNHYAGSGSYGFTNELKSEGVLKQMWGNMNSQECVGLAPNTFGEFIFPYYDRMTELFGKIYWGCCEPVHSIWDDYIGKIKNLGKVSISAWCDERFMGERLANSNVIYSRKPSPNFIGVPTVFDENEFREHINFTLKCTRDCNIEFIIRDVYSLKSDKQRAKKAVEIVRQCISNR